MSGVFTTTEDLLIFPWGDTMTGNELKARREEMGLTQEQLADPLGIAYQNIQKWEKLGDRQANIKAKYWSDLARLLALPVDAFYPEQEEGGSSATSISDNGSTSISVGRNAGQISTTGESSFPLRPLERQAIELNREFGNDSILKRFIGSLLKIKSLSDSIF